MTDMIIFISFIYISIIGGALHLILASVLTAQLCIRYHKFDLKNNRKALSFSFFILTTANIHTTLPMKKKRCKKALKEDAQ